MINSFKRKSFKWPGSGWRVIGWLIIGVITAALIGIACLANPEAASGISRKTAAANNVNIKTSKSTPSGNQTGNTSNQAGIPDNQDNSVQREIKYLASLNIILPKNLSIDKSNDRIYNIKDENGNILGDISAIDYVNNFDLMTEHPNHAYPIKDESFNTNLGKCRLITFDADNGTAASGITGTHYLYYASVTVEGKVIYELTFTEYNKTTETKEKFIQILKSLSIK